MGDLTEQRNKALQDLTIAKEKEIYKNFDPMIDEAIAEFNEELKNIAKKKLL